MEIGYISAENLDLFSSLLLQGTVDALLRGEPVTAIGLTDASFAVGAVAGILEGRRLHLTSLYVAPDFRRRGGGRMLLEAMKEAAEEFAAGISVDFTSTLPEHNSLVPFLIAEGFLPKKSDNMIFVATLQEICDADFFKNKHSAGGFPFTKLGSAALSVISKTLTAKSLPVPSGGLGSELVDRDVSTIYLKNEKPSAYIVVSKAEVGLELSAVWVGSASPALVAELLCSAVHRAKQKYPKDIVLYMQTPSAEANALLRKLVPSARSVSHSWILTLR